MKRTLILAVFLAVQLRGAIQPASAAIYVGVDQITVHNQTDVCAWVTLSESARHMIGWYILDHGRDVRPRYVKAHSDWVARPSEPLPAYIKVRAQFSKNADCNSGVVDDKYDTSESIVLGSRQAWLGKVGTGYWVTVGL